MSLKPVFITLVLTLFTQQIIAEMEETDTDTSFWTAVASESFINAQDDVKYRCEFVLYQYPQRDFLDFLEEETDPKNELDKILGTGNLTKIKSEKFEISMNKLKLKESDWLYGPKFFVEGQDGKFLSSVTYSIEDDILVFTLDLNYDLIVPIFKANEEREEDIIDYRIDKVRVNSTEGKYQDYPNMIYLKMDLGRRTDEGFGKNNLDHVLELTCKRVFAE